MTSDQQPPSLLEPTSLEVRGAWDGIPDHPAKVRISMEVQCLPNASLHILDARSSSIRLCKVKHFHIDMHDPSQNPDSPLFAFLNGNAGASGEDEQVSIEACPPASTSGTEIFAMHPPVPDECPLPQHGASLESPFLEIGEPLRPSIPTTGTQSMSSVNTNGQESHDSGKRDAKTACLTDSGNEKENTSQRSRLDAREDPTIQARTRKTAASASPKKSAKSSAPLKSRRVKSSSISAITDLEESLISGFKNIISEACGKESADFPFGITPPAKTGSSCEAQESLDKQKSPVKSKSLIPVLQRLDTDLGRQQSASTAAQNRGGPHQDTPQLLHTHNLSPTSQVLVVEPIIKNADGILYMECPAGVRQGVYRIVIHASVAMIDEGQRIDQPLHSPRWHTLIIPGLPKLRDDQNGMFMFLVSQGQVIEFSTTTLYRYNMVENCFVAEFANLEPLRFPMCVYDQEYYGPLRDFTVNQCIKTTYVQKKSGGEPLSDLRMRYHAMCSLKFNNLYVATERCYFFVRVEGGPGSFSQCAIDPKDEGLQVIQLSDNVSTTMEIVSRIQIICSSRDFDEFCLTWESAIPEQKRGHFLPFISPELPDSWLNRSKLRSALARLESDPAMEALQSDVEQQSSKMKDQDSGPEMGSELGLEVRGQTPSKESTTTDSTSEETSTVAKIIEKLEVDRSESPPLDGYQVFFILLLVVGLLFTILLLPFLMEGLRIKTYDNCRIWDPTGGMAQQGRESYYSGNATLYPACICPSYPDSPILSAEKKLDPEKDPEPVMQDPIEKHAEIVDWRKRRAKRRGTVPNYNANATTLRDRIDYFLGWKGLTVHQNEQHRESKSTDHSNTISV
ncbi:hypothetical protein BDV59DRAFT_203191 [Aspergillus ambiguus]|uniref:uncharacterized protein n=1 Tax=Aspergillus ambiguus TaxID=176160 RepID=UPI003CCD5A72